jgi:hypothetical protein
MSGWGDLFANKYEEVLDESTGEMIMVDKNAPKYKLDAQGNVINMPPPAAAPAPAAPVFGAAVSGGTSSGAGFQFGASDGGGGSNGGGFTFGGATAAPAAGGFGGATAPAAGGFVFGGATAPASNGGGFVFGGTAVSAPAGAPAGKRKPDDEVGRRTEAKRRRTRDLRLTGDESGRVHIVGNGDCGQIGLGVRAAQPHTLRVLSRSCSPAHQPTQLSVTPSRHTARSTHDDGALAAAGRRRTTTCATR